MLAVLPLTMHMCWGLLYPGAGQGLRGSMSSDPKYRELWVLPDFLYDFGKTPWHVHFSSPFLPFTQSLGT